MARLLKNASKIELSQEVKKLLIGEYLKFYKEEFSKSELINNIPEENREQFLNEYLEGVVYSQAYLEDYNFLFEPIEKVLSENAFNSVDNAADVFVEQFIEEELNKGE